MPITEQDLIERERALCLQDFSYFRDTICGYRDFQPFHDKVDKVLLSPSKYKRIIIPRNHLKSSAVMSWVLWCILKNPDLSILYESSIYAQAMKYLGEMKKHLESPVWNKYFGDWVGKPWTDSQLMVNKRKKIQPASTISASGVDKAQTGQHYDIIVLDDLVNENNSKTIDQREKVIDRYKQALSLLRPQGIVVVVGTPWDRDDLYGWMDKNPSIIGLFEQIKLDVYDEDGRILFHEKFCETIEEEKVNPHKRSLENLRVQLGAYQFSCQYRCNAEAEDFAEFKKSWLKWSPVKDINSRLKSMRGRVIIKCDPAMGKEHTKRPCDTAIIHAHYMPNHKIDVLFEDVTICTPGDTIEKLHSYAMAYVGMGLEVEVMIEDVGFQGYLVTRVEEKMRASGRHYSVISVPPIGDKHKRVRALFPYYQSGQITHSEAIKGKKLEDQLIRFPRGDKIDAADAHSQYINMINFPIVHHKKSPEDFDYGVPVKDAFNDRSRRAPLDKGRKQQSSERSYLSETKGIFYDIG